MNYPLWKCLNRIQTANIPENARMHVSMATWQLFQNSNCIFNWAEEPISFQMICHRGIRGKLVDILEEAFLVSESSVYT